MPTTAPLAPLTSFQNQTSALVRHAVTAGGTAFTILGAFALLPADQVEPAITALRVIGDDVNKLTGDLGALWLIIGPVAIGLASKGAAFAASLKGQLTSITRNPAVEIPPGSKIIAPAEVADAVPSSKVVPPV